MTQVPRSVRKRKQSSEGVSPERAQQLDKRLLAYALAGAGAVSLTPAASAEIVFTPAHVTINSGTIRIDLNHDGLADFKVVDSQAHSYYAWGGHLDVRARNLQSGVVQVQKYWAFAASNGFPIGPDSPLPFSGSGVMVWAFFSYNGHRFGGPWANVANKFLGFQFDINGETHYGWARFSVSARGSFPTITATLTGYAYETEPDKTILAGDRGIASNTSIEGADADDASVDSTPSRVLPSLGLLSLGSIGLEAWRKQGGISEPDPSN